MTLLRLVLKICKTKIIELKMEYSIEKIDREHMTDVLSLIKELAVYEKEPNAVIIDEAVLEKALFDDGLAYGWVAIRDKEVVGLAICYLRFSTWNGPCAYLEDLIVRQEWRGNGIGEALLQVLIEDTKKRNLPFVQWQVLDWNESAVRFYEKLGAQIDKGWWNVRFTLDQER
jgi:ribosomal protein S18 acetylase RimI-like enzyme